MISCLTMDLFIDLCCVSDETSGGGGLGEVRGPAGMYQNVSIALSLHPCEQSMILLRPNRDALIVQQKDPDETSAPPGPGAGWDCLNQVLVCIPWIRKSK
jgi:hypothetical protein